jgi:RNA polymerase sigma-70 factor (ECF subfamily)
LLAENREAFVAAAVRRTGPLRASRRPTLQPPAPAVAATSASSPARVPDELVAAAVSSDRVAVERLLTIIRPLVVRYCRSRLGADSGDDVAQEVCLAVLTALPGYRVQGRPFLAFVYGIASHKVIDAHRASSRARSEPVAEVPEPVGMTVDPEAGVPYGEQSARLRALIDQLPDKQREILVLRVVVGLSAEETADAVGATPGAVRVAEARALRRLQVPHDIQLRT